MSVQWGCWSTSLSVAGLSWPFFVVCLCREIKGNSCFKLLWISYVNRLKWRRHRNFCRGTVWKVVSHICSYMAQLCLISWIADSTSNSWSLMLNWLSAADFFVKSIIYYAVPTRDGPKFGRRRSSAECSARFGSATCDYSAELWPNFGKHSASFVASHLRHFALTAGIESRYTDYLLLVNYQLTCSTLQK